MNTTDKRFQAAMAVMQGLCANTDFTSYSARQISAMAFRQADALLAELDRTETKQPEPAIPTPPKGFTVWGERSAYKPFRYVYRGYSDDM